MKRAFFSMVAAIGISVTAQCANFPIGTYVYAGTAKNYRNELLKAEDHISIQAVATNGAVLAVAHVVDPDSDGVNFRLEVPVSTVATEKSATIGDAPLCVLVTPTGTRGAATETFPPIACSSAVTNCAIVWSEAVSFTNATDTGAVVQIPEDYLERIAFLMEAEGKDAYDPWADWDGDGKSNYAEYAAGTNPFDPSDYLRVTAFSAAPGKSVLLSFEYVGGHLYGLRGARSLSDPEWAQTKFRTGAATTEQTALYAATDDDVGEATLYVTPVADAPQMFYKVEVK